jgi:hypothetical protein
VLIRALEPTAAEKSVVLSVGRVKEACAEAQAPGSKFIRIQSVYIILDLAEWYARLARLAELREAQREQ